MISMQNGVDMHTHTVHSHDGKDPVPAMARAANALGYGIAVTDHFDNQYVGAWEQYAPIDASFAEVTELKKQGMAVFTGIEIGEAVWNKDTADRARYAHPYDVVIGSVHAVRCKSNAMPIGSIPFTKRDDAFIRDYLLRYFEDLYETAGTGIDVLAHLTNPLRYIVGQRGTPVDLAPLMPSVESVLSYIIDKKIALEVNTSMLGTSYDFTMPDEPILRRYREMGGEMLTLASDAHKTDNVAKGFDRTKAMLRGIGFKNLYYFVDRKPIAYDL